jgi:sugar phosphate permease
MFACYILQYLDKTLINYANVMGLKEDTGTTASQFSYLTLAFYVSYCVCEIPQGYLMQRFPTAKYLGLQVILWEYVSLPFGVTYRSNNFQDMCHSELRMQEFCFASCPSSPPRML